MSFTNVLLTFLLAYMLQYI